MMYKLFNSLHYIIRYIISIYSNIIFLGNKHRHYFFVCLFVSVGAGMYSTLWSQSQLNWHHCTKWCIWKTGFACQRRVQCILRCWWESLSHVHSHPKTTRHILVLSTTFQINGLKFSWLMINSAVKLWCIFHPLCLLIEQGVKQRGENFYAFMVPSFQNSAQSKNMLTRQFKI